MLLMIGRNRQTLISKRKRKEMDRNMAISLLIEKLDQRNYVSWSYKMH